jgi:uncharacterized protein (TIGR04255 family)
MAMPRPLPNPPIKEALVDIRIASDAGIDADRLASLRGRLKPEYPKVEEKREFKAELRIDAGKILPPSATDLGFGGLVFASPDGSRVAQFRKDGFTLNQLKPYSGADALILESLRLWEFYRELASPVAVVRVAMRYINAMDLPYSPGDDFRRFLTAPPEMPGGTPQLVSSFLTRMVAHDPPDTVIVTQALEHSGESGPSSVTLDIDAFLTENLPADTNSLEATLRRLRVLKNSVFFALLTDQALELYA